MMFWRKSWRGNGARWTRAGIAVALAIGLLAIGVSFGRPPAEASQSASQDYVAGRVLAKFDASATTAQTTGALARRGLSVLREIEGADIKVLSVPAGDERETVEWLLASGLVEYAAPDYLAHVTISPNDAFWSLQWNMSLVNAPAAWDIITGTRTITIAILDTGIDLDHPDLVSKLVPGSNIINYGVPPDDDHGHGTHVAAVAGAATNNWMGVAGMDWQARLMPVKVCDFEAACPYSDIIDGIYNAVNNGARILNLSLAGWEDFQGLREAIRYATVTRGAIVAVSAGNCGAGGEGCPGLNPVAYPAAYDETIAVGAVTRYDDWAYYSEYRSYVDIAAPGGTEMDPIWSANINGGYYSRNGTSMSAAHVSGLAALIWAINSTLTSAQVWAAIRDSAAKVGSFPYVSGRNNYLGYGRIDAAAALGRVAPSLSVSPTQVSFLSGDNRPRPSKRLTIANGSVYSSMAWSASLVAGSSWFEIVPPLAGTLAPGASAQLEVRPRAGSIAPGTHYGEVRISSTSKAVQHSPQSVNLKLTYLPELYLALLPAHVSMAGGVAGYEWIDAKAEGIALTLPDDGSASLNLPFSFPFYGKSYNKVWVSSNGFISFGQAGAGAYQNDCLPTASTPNNAIYAFWDDLDPSIVGGVYAKAFGSTAYVIQWDGVPHSVVGGGSSVTETFQIVLRSDGSVKFQYQTVGNAGGCTVGVENSSGTLAQQLLCNGSGEALHNRKALWLITP